MNDLDPALELALTQFNQREFYACHDTLEALWTESLDPVRKFYQGLLQIAVAYYHLLQGNWRGCVILLGEGLHKLDATIRPDLEDPLAAFYEQNAQNLSLLHTLGASGLPAFDLDRIPTLMLPFKP